MFIYHCPTEVNPFFVSGKFLVSFDRFLDADFESDDENALVRQIF